MRQMWFLLMALAVSAGCDLLDPAKVGDPVFGPPPPRKVVKSATDPTGKAPDTAVVSPDNPPPADSTEGSVTTARGSSPERGTTQTAALSDGQIKRTGFTGAKVPAGKLTGNEIVASINGQALFASDIFERAATESLLSNGMNLLYANHMLAEKQITEEEYRDLQLLAIRKFGKDYVRTRVLAQAMITMLEKEQQKKIEEAINKEFENYLEKLKKDFKVLTTHEVDQVLHQQGTTLPSIKDEFRYRLLADEYLRGKSKKEHIVGREEVLAYYNAHDKEFSFPEKVHWQLLEIDFDKHGGRDGALKVLGQAVDALRRGEGFSKVAKKYSDGSHAQQGGEQPWVRAESVADERISQTLRGMAAGETSPVLSGREAYRIIRVMERKPAGKKPIAEVQEVIKQILEDKFQKEQMRRVMVEAYQKASIESTYLPPEDLQPPADFAGIPASPKNSDAPAKKGRKHS